MTYWFATLTGPQSSIGMIAGTLAASGNADNLVVDPSADGSVRINQACSDALKPTRLIGDIFALFIAIADSGPTSGLTVTMRFSGVQTPASDIANIVGRWVETGEPPVMTLIGFRVAQNASSHTTDGLYSFIGRELAVHYRTPTFERNALRDLARLTRYVLMGGEVAAGIRFAGVASDICFIDDHEAPPEADYWFSYAMATSALDWCA
jgi:hypothetical protein